MPVGALADALAVSYANFGAVSSDELVEMQDFALPYMRENAKRTRTYEMNE